MSESSATLDDSVSEEEDASFDELADGTPYLQPGVELSVLAEVSDETFAGQRCRISCRWGISSLFLSTSFPLGRPCENVFSFFFFSACVLFA